MLRSVKEQKRHKRVTITIVSLVTAIVLCIVGLIIGYFYNAEKIGSQFAPVQEQSYVSDIETAS